LNHEAAPRSLASDILTVLGIDEYRKSAEPIPPASVVKGIA
jgi:hypothetical protein